MGEGTKNSDATDRTFINKRSPSSREQGSEKSAKRDPISPEVERVILAIEKQTQMTVYRTSHLVDDLAKCITPETVEAAIAAVWTVKGNNLVTAVSVACGSTRPKDAPPTPPKPQGAAYQDQKPEPIIDLRTPEERAADLATLKAARAKNNI